MTYTLTQEQVHAAIAGHDLGTYAGWCAAAWALLKNAPSWTALDHPAGGEYVIKYTDKHGRSALYTCARHLRQDHPPYSTHDIFELEPKDLCGAWDDDGQSWNDVPKDQNFQAITSPVFVALHHMVERHENLDPRIGELSSGLFYAHIDGPHNPPFEGTLQQVHNALIAHDQQATKA